MMHNDELFSNCGSGELWRVGDAARCLALFQLSGRFGCVIGDAVSCTVLRHVSFVWLMLVGGFYQSTRFIH